MIMTYKEASNSNDFCKCEKSSSVLFANDEWGYWDVCSDCNKPIEDSYNYDSNDYLAEVCLRDD